jgi:hypothetical protein
MKTGQREVNLLPKQAPIAALVRHQPLRAQMRVANQLRLDRRSWNHENNVIDILVVAAGAGGASGISTPHSNLHIVILITPLVPHPTTKPALLSQLTPPAIQSPMTEPETGLSMTAL